MQHIAAFEQIETRAKALNLGLERLAALAGVNPSTLHRCRQPGHDPRLSTQNKLIDALDAEERRLLDYLAKLHPLAVIQYSTVALCEDRKPPVAGAGA